MKLLENVTLDQLADLMHTLSLTTGSCKLHLKLESYSCKMTGDDKKLLKQIATSNDEGLLALSPPTQGYGPSSPTRTGQLQDACSAKTFHCLVSTLNASFRPDYDFSNAKSEEFSRIPSLTSAVEDIHNMLYTCLGDSFTDIREHMWNTIDREIMLSDCATYSYNADLDSDPYGEALWYVNYFFYNKKMKRLLFFSCQSHPYSDTSEVDDEEYSSDYNLNMSVEEEDE